MPTSNRHAQVAIIMGSDSDLPIMKQAGDALKKFGVEYSMAVMSAHRSPKETARFAETARTKGLKVVIAGAGGAAHLAGVVAAFSTLPVIGVPIPLANLGGQDSLLSIVQMPKGIPVATVAIGNAWNAGVLAAQILATDSSSVGKAIASRLADYKKEMRDAVLAKKIQ